MSADQDRAEAIYMAKLSEQVRAPNRGWRGLSQTAAPATQAL